MAKRFFNAKGDDITDSILIPPQDMSKLPESVKLPDPNYKPPSGMDIIKMATRTLGGALPVAGGIAGAASGAGFGGPLGVGAGTATQDFLKSVSPDYFGDPPKDLGDVALDVGGNMALDYGTGLAGGFISKLPRKAAIGLAGAGAVGGDALLSDEKSTIPDRLANGMMGAMAVGGGAGAIKAGYNRVTNPRLKPNAINIADGMKEMGAPLTTANISDNPLVRRLTEVMAPETSSRIAGTQTKAAENFLKGEIPQATFGPEEVGKGVQANIIQGNDAARNIKNAAWNKLKTNADRVKQYPEIGAILGQSVNTATNIINDVFKNQIPGFSNKIVRELIIGREPKYQELLETVQKLKQTQGADPSLIQDLKSITGDLGNYGNPHPTRAQLSFRQVSEALKADIQNEYKIVDESVRQARKDATVKLAEARKRDPLGTYKLNDFLDPSLHGTSKFSLEKDYNDALGRSEEYMKTYGTRDAPGTFKAMTAGATANTPAENLSSILGDADKIASTIKASGSPEVTRGLLGQQWLADIFDKSFKGSSGSQTKTLIDMLKNTNEQGKLSKLFTPAKRLQLEKVGDAMASIPKTGDSWASGSNALRMSGAGITLGIAGGQMLMDENHKIPLWPAGVLALGLTGTGFAHALLKDSVAQTIIRNAGKKISTLSPADTGIMLKALRGSEVFLMTPKGKVEGSIDDEGKFVQKTKK